MKHCHRTLEGIPKGEGLKYRKLCLFRKLAQRSKLRSLAHSCLTPVSNEILSRYCDALIIELHLQVCLRLGAARACG